MPYFDGMFKYNFYYKFQREKKIIEPYKGWECVLLGKKPIERMHNSISKMIDHI